MSTVAVASLPDKHWVRRSFAAAAPGYDGVAALQRATGHALLARWPRSGSAPGVILDVGAGTGYFAAELMGRYPDSRLIALDIAEGMLRVARERALGRGGSAFVCGDAEALPLADRSVDLIFSNLAIQWCPNLASVFQEFRRVLKPNGRALFSTFGENTLTELRAAWAAVDAFPHVNDFTPVERVAAALREAGFSGVELRSERRILNYRDPLALMKELKGLGAHNVSAGRPRHLTGKGVLRKVLDAYGPLGEIGEVQATFEVIYGYVKG